MINCQLFLDENDINENRSTEAISHLSIRLQDIPKSIRRKSQLQSIVGYYYVYCSRINDRWEL